MAAKKKSSIAIKKSHLGLLHEDTGTPEGQPIPASKLMEALHSPSKKVRKRAQFAENAKGFKH